MSCCSTSSGRGICIKRTEGETEKKKKPTASDERVDAFVDRFEEGEVLRRRRQLRELEVVFGDVQADHSVHDVHQQGG